jgi:hypothetical protein
MMRIQCTSIRSRVSSSLTLGTSMPYLFVRQASRTWWACFTSFSLIPFISCPSLRVNLKPPANKPFAAAVYVRPLAVLPVTSPSHTYHIQLGPSDAESASQVIHVSIDDRLLDKQVRMSIIQVSASDESISQTRGNKFHLLVMTVLSMRPAWISSRMRSSTATPPSAQSVHMCSGSPTEVPCLLCTCSWEVDIAFFRFRNLPLTIGFGSPSAG